MPNASEPVELTSTASPPRTDEAASGIGGIEESGAPTVAASSDTTNTETAVEGQSSDTAPATAPTTIQERLARSQQQLQARLAKLGFGSDDQDAYLATFGADSTPYAQL